MNLLEIPRIQSRMARIADTHGLEDEENPVPGRTSDVDRFFWIRASESVAGEGPRFTFRSMVHDMDRKGMGEFRICNLVLQGGGTLGLAHAGFVAGLEAAGVRFRRAIRCAGHCLPESSTIRREKSYHS